MKILFISLLGILLIQSCISKKSESASVPATFIDTSKIIDTTLGVITELSMDATDATEAIVAANQIYGQRFLTNDSSFYQAKYTADAVIYPVQHPMVQGRESIGKYYYDGGKNKKLRILIKALNITGTSDLIVEEGSYDFPDDKGGSFDKGKFIALWKQEDGSWKLWREIWNTDLPPNGMIQ